MAGAPGASGSLAARGDQPRGKRALDAGIPVSPQGRAAPGFAPRGPEEPGLTPHRRRGIPFLAGAQEEQAGVTAQAWQRLTAQPDVERTEETEAK